MGFFADLLRRLRGAPEPILDPGERVRIALARLKPTDRRDAEAVRQEAIEDLGSERAADEWLSHKVPFLGHVRPIDLVRNRKGRGAVRDVLYRMRYGIYS
ncbi:MAG: antitoxin Xre/MbcA/ParS toxin-binding domain-containing protein [Reyranellaceae bacterium]